VYLADRGPKLAIPFLQRMQKAARLIRLSSSTVFYTAEKEGMKKQGERREQATERVQPEPEAKAQL
jgi:hypothetical protein